MKKTIVILGVGSTYFTRGIVESLITARSSQGGEANMNSANMNSWDVRLVDIDPECLEIATLLSKRLVELYQAPVTITGSLDRREVLAGADAVVSTIGVGGRRAWEKDVASSGNSTSTSPLAIPMGRAASHARCAPSRRWWRSPATSSGCAPRPCSSTSPTR